MGVFKVEGWYIGGVEEECVSEIDYGRKKKRKDHLKLISAYFLFYFC